MRRRAPGRVPAIVPTVRADTAVTQGGRTHGTTVRTVISPSRYVQGKGAIHQLGEYLKPIGSTPLLVADDLVWGLVGHDVEASLKAAGLPVQRETFNGIPSAKEVDRLVEVIKATGADVAVAVGGGSTIDAVKAAGYLAGHPLGELPDGRLHRRAVQRPVGDLHRGRRVRGVPVLPAQPRPGARRLADRRQRAGRRCSSPASVTRWRPGWRPGRRPGRTPRRWPAGCRR